MVSLSSLTLVAYGLLLVLLAVAAAIDLRTRRIPNAVPVAIVALWVVWRVALGLSGVWSGIGFWAEVWAPAPPVIVPPGLVIGGLTPAGGVVGAIVLGGGLLVLTAGYEAFAHRESFGGGDIKLMAALGLFLGLERGVICLLAACVLSLLFAAVRALVLRRRQPESEGDEADAPPLLAATVPFAPFIALGALVAFVA